MGNHRQALQIYVFQLQDYQKAEEYCNQTYLTTPQPPSPTKAFRPATTVPSTPDLQDAEPSIYHTLLSLYLTPPPPHQPNWPPALDLLSKHGARLPAATTLELVPATLPVKELESYFRGRIRNANSIMNEERIVSRLRGVEKAAVDAAYLLGDGRVDSHGRKIPGGLNRRVVIDEDRHCAVCHKRFGGSAIRVYPDNSVVHSGCMRSSVGKRNTSGWR
jgi:Vam6/Vps39-like protein vacuolar protein sorting-associated protein 39